ncbi:unnamed protein product, partial [Owenia fusiformis]
MPQLDRWAVLQLSLLILAVPAQYMISKYMDSPSTERSQALRKILSSALELRNKYFTWKSWEKWYRQIVQNLRAKSPSFKGNADDEGESPAIEVMKYRDPKGHFADSPEPRRPRPPEVKYRVGQVIKHKIWGYRGVIIGWDPKARAPEEWLQANHPPNKKHWRDMPNYSILVDTRDRMSPQTTYVPQENIEIVRNTAVVHPLLHE